MLLQDLIHTTKAHPWWVVAFVLPLVVVARRWRPSISPPPLSYLDRQKNKDS